MKIKIARKIGKTKYIFEVEDANGFNCLMKASVFSSMPERCSLCGNEEIHLTSNKAKGYQFVKMICPKCNARAQLGQYKDGGYYWKGWENYEPPAVSKAAEEEHPEGEQW